MGILSGHTKSTEHPGRILVRQRLSSRLYPIPHGHLGPRLGGGMFL